MQEYRESLGDTSAAGIPTHVTLVPPIEVSAANLPAMMAHLSGAAALTDRFQVLLRGTGTFRPISPVVFVTLAQGISACEQLAQRIRTGPLAVDLDFPYHPHVTVAHHLGEQQLDRAFSELADFECQFEVTQFHLYLHDELTGWHPDRAFDLN